MEPRGRMEPSRRMASAEDRATLFKYAERRRQFVAQIHKYEAKLRQQKNGRKGLLREEQTTFSSSSSSSSLLSTQSCLSAQKEKLQPTIRDDALWAAKDRSIEAQMNEVALLSDGIFFFTDNSSRQLSECKYPLPPKAISKEKEREREEEEVEEEEEEKEAVDEHKSICKEEKEKYKDKDNGRDKEKYKDKDKDRDNKKEKEGREREKKREREEQEEKEEAVAEHKLISKEKEKYKDREREREEEEEEEQKEAVNEHKLVARSGSCLVAEMAAVKVSWQREDKLENHYLPSDYPTTVTALAMETKVPHLPAMNSQKLGTPTEFSVTLPTLNIRIKSVDMAAPLQEHAIQSAQDILASTAKVNFKRVAYTLKKEFDKVYGPAWHCIVGASFGSYVTHSLGGFVYFSVDKVSVLLFKTAVEPLEH